MLRVEGIDLHYGASQALWRVSLTAAVGEITCVLGRNGVGKTSTLRAVCGQVQALGRPDRLGRAGHHRPVHGRARPARHRAGAAGARDLPAADRRGEPADRVRRPAARRSAGSPSNLRAVPGPEGHAAPQGRRPLRRPAAAARDRPRAGHAAQLLVLDEPTEGIQPSIIKDIGRVLELLRAQGQMAILLVEQYLDFARGLADRLAVMDRGQVVLAGRPTSSTTRMFDATSLSEAAPTPTFPAPREREQERDRAACGGEGRWGSSTSPSPAATARTRLAHLYQRTPLRALFPRHAATTSPSPPWPMSAAAWSPATGRDRGRVGEGAAAWSPARRPRRSTARPAPTQRRDAPARRARRLARMVPAGDHPVRPRSAAPPLRLDLAGGARAMLGEMLVLGRLASGERASHGLLHDRIEVCRGRRLAWPTACGLRASYGRSLAAAAGLGGAAALATFVYAAPDAADRSSWPASCSPPTASTPAPRVVNGAPGRPLPGRRTRLRCAALSRCSGPASARPRPGCRRSCRGLARLRDAMH